MASKAKTPEVKRVRGAQRTTREDWVRTALDILIRDGIESVKASAIASRLDCARSSFYWYFKDRQTLLDVLLDHWQATNTQAIVSKASAAATSINDALTNVFTCWVEDESTGQRPFNSHLDFAVRDWARKDDVVRRVVAISDDSRIMAIRAMFERFGYEADEASIRARIVYFTQIGYEALDARESRLDRAKTGPHYLYCMTGIRPNKEEIRRIVAQADNSSAISDE